MIIRRHRSRRHKLPQLARASRVRHVHQSLIRTMKTVDAIIEHVDEFKNLVKDVFGANDKNIFNHALLFELMLDGFPVDLKEAILKEFEEKRKD